MRHPAGRGLAYKTARLLMQMQKASTCPDGLQTVHVAHAVVASARGAWANAVCLLHGFSSAECAAQHRLQAQLACRACSAPALYGVGLATGGAPRTSPPASHPP